MQTSEQAISLLWWRKKLDAEKYGWPPDTPNAMCHNVGLAYMLKTQTYSKSPLASAARR